MKTQIPMISLGKYLLRDVNEYDYMDYYEVGKDLETVKYLSWGPFTKPSDSLWVIINIFMKRIDDGLPVGYAIVDKRNGKMIGMIDYHTYYPEINAGEIGYVLHRSYWNRGIISSALKEVIKVGFDYLNLDKIIIRHVEENIASKKVILKNGFRYESTSNFGFQDREGYYHNIINYSIYKFEYKGD